MLRNARRDTGLDKGMIFLSLLIYALCCVPLIWILVGIPLLLVIGLASLVLAIVAAIKASDGGCYHYPLTLRLVK